MRLKIKNLLYQNYLILLAIILVGLFLRTYQLRERFLYSHDQDLAGWFIKDVVIDKHLRLVGQETSTQGIFIGPFFYYLQIPFYLFSHMDPIGGTYLVTFLGILTMVSIYFVFSQIFDKKVGLIGAFIYAVSFYTVNNDREVVPTMPVILWSVWFLYGLSLLLKNEQKKASLVFGILMGLIWHINFALILPVILIPIAYYFSRKRFEYKNLAPGLIALFVTSLPLLLFEVRHGFQQTKAMFYSLTTPQSDTVFTGYEKFQRVWYLMSKNIHGLFMGTFPWLSFESVSFIFVVILIFLIVKKIIDRRLLFLVVIWILIYIFFFSSYSKIVSEYYLNGVTIIWILTFSVCIWQLLKRSDIKHFGVMILSFFFVFNLNKFFSYDINASGYVQRKDIVSEIKRNSNDRGYPCVSVSYITDPGYNLGYRYFFWLLNVKTAPIGNDVPVYTIVFPLKPIFVTDVNKGAIGLIYPNHESYAKERIEKGCSGENSNLTDPLFGFTR